MEKLNPKRIENILALTPLQEGLLFHYLQEPQSGLYFEQLCLSISGPVHLKLFAQAWNIVVETNEMLRSLFRWEKLEKPSLIILKEHPCRVIFYDLAENTTLEEIKYNDRRRPFDLQQVPFRVTLVKRAENEYEMIISNHHILYDGWSNGIILREFFQVYHRLCRGEQVVKIPAKPPFKEFVRWMQSRDKISREKYWREYLAGFEPPAESFLKKDCDVAAGANDYALIFAGALIDQLDAFVKNNRVTLAAIFYTAWGLLLQKYGGSEDVVFGTTVSGRSAAIEGIEDMVGLFINTIPLRIQTNAGVKMGALLARTGQMLREREGFEDTPPVDIAACSGLGSGLFNTFVAIENYPLDNDLVPPGSLLSVNSYAIVESTPYDLSVGIMLHQGIEINFSGFFAEATLKSLAGHFKCIIQAIIDSPETAFAALDIISGAEKKRILYEFNDTAREYPVHKTIHQLFVEQALRAPDHIALVGAGPRVCPGFFSHGRTRTNTDENGAAAITYRQLNGLAGGLAGWLMEKGVMADSIVGIMMERSLEMVVGILGILKAGGAYLPIAPEFPQERIAYMLKDSAAKLLLTAKEIVFNSHHSSFIIHHSKPQQLAYIIYTSGSTGKPKGVLIEHAAVVNRLFWVKERYGLTERDVVLQAAPFIFDVSVCEMFRWIPAGARLCLLPPGGQMDPDVIVNTIAKFSATTADFVPSMINLILDRVDKLRSYHELASLRWLFTGVETVRLGLVKRFLETLGQTDQTKLINAYGPTESTVDVTYFQCRENYDGDVVPIGKPMANVQIYIIDRWGKLQPLGISGELCIGGKGLARGYLNNPELTGEKLKIKNYKL